MKTNDILLVGALGVAGYFIFQKFLNPVNQASDLAGAAYNAGSQAVGVGEQAAGDFWSGFYNLGKSLAPQATPSVPVVYGTTSYKGDYNSSSNVFTSPQGYQMSVAPANVASVAAKFSSNNPVPVTASSAGAIATQSLMGKISNQSIVAAGLGVPQSYVSKAVNNIDASGKVNVYTKGSANWYGQQAYNLSHK